MTTYLPLFIVLLHLPIGRGSAPAPDCPAAAAGQRQPSSAEEAALGAGSEVACEAWFDPIFLWLNPRGEMHVREAPVSGACRCLSNCTDLVEISTGGEAVKIAPSTSDKLSYLLPGDDSSRHKMMLHGVLLLGDVDLSHVTDAVGEVGVTARPPG